MNCIKKEYLFMLNSKSRIVLSSLSALGLIGAGVAAHHVDVDLFNSASDVKTPTVKAESKQISDSKKSEVKSATTYSAPAASIGSTIGSEVASILENEINNVSDNDDKVEQNVEPVVESESVDKTDASESEQNVEPVVESQIDNSETNIVPDVAPTTEPVVEQVSDTHTDSNQSETNSKHTEPVSEEPVFETTEVVEQSQPVYETSSANTVETTEVTETTTVTEVTTESLPEASVVETPKVSEPVVEAPVVHEEVKPSVVSVSYDQSNTYPVGQCTWGVKSVAPWVGNYWGNANQWGESARRAGFRTGYTPQVGSVIVFPNSIYEGVNYGHVGYVTAVNADGTIEMVESNYRGNMYVSNYRGAFTPSSDVYYIYPNN
jgi:pcsB protein